MREGNNTSILNLSYVREVDNNNLLSGKLEKLSNLPPLNPLLARREKEKEGFLARRGIVWIICCLFSCNANAVCTPTPDCASIGYTETSCETISLKCPFDQTKLYCFPCDSSYQYTCSNSNEYGDGESCKGKYKSCCNTDCVVGAIYYSDKTCSSCVDSTKTPIGVVVKDNELVMSKDRVIITWGGYGTDISNLSNNYDASSAKSDYSGTSNTNNIISIFGTSDTSNYAGVYCYNYAPIGMESSKGQWYMPATGELFSYVYSNYGDISSTYSKHLGYETFDYYLWSSTEGHATCVWAVNFQNGNVTTPDKNHQHSLMCFLKI